MISLELYNDDCVDRLAKMDPESIDLVVTSPPYDNLRSYNDSLDWNFETFTKVADGLFNVLKDGGVVVWIVNDATINGSETGTSFKQALYFKEIGFNLHDTMIYHKKSLAFPESNRYYPCYEYMFIFSKGKPKTTNLIKDRINAKAGQVMTNTERQIDGSIKMSNGAKLGRRHKKYGVRFNIWSYGTGYGKSAKNPIAFEHPAIFPLDLAKDHIISWSNPDDIVLDPFMGSGTTAVACLQTDRRFIGIEKEKEYFDLAVRRINDAKIQRKLTDYYGEER